MWACPLVFNLVWVSTADTLSFEEAEVLNAQLCRESPPRMQTVNFPLIKMSDHAVLLLTHVGSISLVQATFYNEF